MSVIESQEDCDNIDCFKGSRLKAIQGAGIKDLTEAQFGPPKFGGSHSACRRPTDLLYPSPNSLKATNVSLTQPNDINPSIVELNPDQVSIPTKPKYIPNQRPPPTVHSSRPNNAANQKERARKVVISRFLLIDGNISFAIGTDLDGVITPDAEEVPVAKILDYVSPAELERFENQDFFDEDERERLLPPKKPRGRPRKGDGIIPSFNTVPIGQETSREQSLLPDAPILIKKKIGRPKGTFRKKAVNLTSTKPSVLSKPSTAIKRGRGRPRRQPNLSVVIPSFNGPQPQELESTPTTPSESDKIIKVPKPQYSMITASGLGQSDTEDVTSRDRSLEVLPSSRRRRLGTESASLDPSHDEDDAERSPTQAKRVKMFPDMSPDPIADDNIALLRQFQARVYGPDRPEKGSDISHRQCKPSLTSDSNHPRIRRSSLDSSSSDSTRGHTQRPLKSLPIPKVPSKPLPEEEFPRPPPGDNSTKVLTPCLDSSITVPHSPSHHPAKTPPARSTSPSKSIRRKVSLTPHIPPSTSVSYSKSLHRPAQSGSQPSISSAGRQMPPQPSDTTLSQTSRITPSLPEKRKPPSPTPQSAPSQSTQASSPSKLGFAGLPRETAITDYFAPKASTVTKTPPPTIKPRYSPTMQLIGAADNDSDSEDQLAHVDSSTTDSIGSEAIIVRRPNRVTPPTTTQAAVTSSSAHNHDLDSASSADDESSSSSSSSSEEDAHEHEHEAPTNRPVSNAAASSSPAQSTSTTTSTTKTTTKTNVQANEQVQHSADTLSRALDDEVGEEDPASESDGLSTEVMVVRSDEVD